MAQEFLDFVTSQLTSLPADHPDRAFLEQEWQRGRLQVFEQKKQAFAPTLEVLDLHAETEQAIGDALKDYKAGDRSKEAISHTWEGLWAVWGRLMGISPTFTPLERAPKHLPGYEKLGRTLVYIPPEAATPEVYLRLGRLLNTGSTDPHNFQVRHVHDDQFGWLLAETGRNLPMPLPTYRPEDRLGFLKFFPTPIVEAPPLYSAKLKMVEAGKVELMTVNTYLIANAFLKRTTGEYMDTGGSSLLLGSRVSTQSGKEPGRIPYASVHSLSPRGEVIQPFIKQLTYPLYSPPNIRTVSLRYK